ncbi:MAG: hypothetical protein RIS86_1534 [Planctomycetota bacterium]
MRTTTPKPAFPPSDAAGRGPSERLLARRGAVHRRLAADLAGAVPGDPPAPLSRRGFLAIGAATGVGALLGGCASRGGSGLPRGDWADASGALGPPCAATPEAAAATGLPTCTAALPWARPRADWTSAPPDLSDLNPMLPVRAVTVHHDGLDALVAGTALSDMAARIERYRAGHRARGWADIGYHLVIDRGGVLWEGRAACWQGAHVKDHNEGNVGVLVMGNFELQQPTGAQLATLERVLADLMRVHGVARSAVLTHREWPGARTLCPGRNLQPRIDGMRRDGGLLARAEREAAMAEKLA